jgi:hypothetical protein
VPARNVPLQHLSSPSEPAPELPMAAGSLAYDGTCQKVGEVMAVDGGRYWLRPPNGGTEWNAFRSDIRPATASDRIRPALAEVNARSREGGKWG